MKSRYFCFIDILGIVVNWPQSATVHFYVGYRAWYCSLVGYVSGNARTAIRWPKCYNDFSGPSVWTNHESIIIRRKTTINIYFSRLVNGNSITASEIKYPIILTWSHRLPIGSVADTTHCLSLVQLRSRLSSQHSTLRRFTNKNACPSFQPPLSRSPALFLPPLSLYLCFSLCPALPFWKSKCFVIEVCTNLWQFEHGYCSGCTCFEKCVHVCVDVHKTVYVCARVWVCLCLDGAGNQTRPL